MPLRFGLFLALLCLSLCACTRPTAETTELHHPAQPLDAPQGLPSDLVPDSAPKPPPNHDGGLEHDAGITYDTAVAFDQEEQPGRIADNQDEDGWILQADARTIVGFRIQNKSDAHAVHVRIMDAQHQDVMVPAAFTVAASTTYATIFEMPKVSNGDHLMLVLSADGPVDYTVKRERR